MDEREELIDCCQKMEEYIGKIEKMSEEIEFDRDKAEEWEKRAGELRALYQQEVALREAERKTYMNLIQDKDMQIKIYSDSYQLVIQSKWWKLTKLFRYIQEVIQKHFFHKKTMTETLSEIADISRYKAVQIDVDSQTSPVMVQTQIISKQWVEEEYEVKVSIVIPTYNPGAQFKNLLSMLKGQRGIAEIEIIVVDSGSEDETIDICEYFGVKTVEISQQEFSHSYARNLGAEKAEGDYILFMTQDAEPTDSAWLYRLVSVLEEHKVVAASPAETDNGRGDLKYLVDSWNHDRYLGIESGDKISHYDEDMSVEEVRKNAQLTDISCIVRRDVFEQYKYEGDFAEDLRLGLQLIKAGYEIAQLGSVKVKHTHRRPCGYWMKRVYVDSRTLCKIFPDMEWPQLTKPQVVASIINGYCDVCTLIKDIDESLADGMDAKEVCEELNRIAEIPVGKRTLEFGCDFSDEFSDAMIQKIAESSKKVSEQQETLSVQVCAFIKNNLIPYLKAHDEKVDKKEIIETIFKTFAGEAGACLAVYSIGITDELTRLAKENFIGV